MATAYGSLPHASDPRPPRAPVVLLADGEGRLYAKLYQRLRELIQGGCWPPGMRLPSSRALAEDLGLARNTVSVAIEQLVAEGWAEARNRSGVFVSSRLPEAPVAETPAISPTASEANGTEAIPEYAVDVFPLQHWRKLQDRLWQERAAELMLRPASGGEAELRRTIAEHCCVTRGFSPAPDQIVITADLQAAIRLVKQVTRAAPFLTIETAPLGRPLSAARRKAALRWAASREGWIIERDCDGWAATLGGRPVPPLRAAADSGRVIYVRALGELLFPALQLSFMVVPRPLLAAVQEQVALAAPEPPRSDQLLMRAFIESGRFAAHLRLLRREMQERRARLIRILQPHAKGRFTIAPTGPARHLVLNADAEVRPRLAEILRHAGLPVSAVRRSILVGFAGLDSERVGQVADRISRSMGGVYDSVAGKPQSALAQLRVVSTGPS
jgi:GntR family transcriptional regulator / MocR family aminotransferase